MGPLSIAAVGWLMGSLINKAVTESLEAWAKRKGLGKEFKTLKDQLLQLDARLTSAQCLHTNNRFLKELVQNLQHLAYQAENLLDELDYYRLKDQIQQRGTQEKENCSNKSLVASSSSGYLLGSHPIISTLEGLYCRFAPYAPVPLPETTPSKINLSRRMNELAGQLQKSEEEVRNAMNTEISQIEATNLRQTSSFLNDPSVFGRDQERDELINLLVGKVSVLAIVGTGGVGKTNLAQLVFNDPEVDSYFDVRLWICVSTRFDIVRLTREMLEGAYGNRCDLSNLNELQSKLKNELDSKRFLLVLDDMWEDKDKSQWNSMVAPLNYCRGKGGIILVTTRNQSVVKMINARDISLYGFGRDQDRDQLINLLKNEESPIVGKVPVLAIVGTGGVGKTTLARLVFNDPKVDSYFDVRLWICVSTRFDIVRLTREMLEGACGNRCNLSNLNELQNKLKNELDSKRFLLVLDDIWEDKDKSQWDSMVAPLNYCKGKGGIILVTTRNQSVAKMINARDISLHGIAKNDFLSFFSTCIFNDPNYGGNLRLRNIGQEIANKLEGNPLAAKTVSALLKENLDERYWMKIRDSEEWKSQNGPNDILPALRLSYEHMPFHLQRCFSYCAIFPKDHPFTRTNLVYLWMAQGFLDVRSEGKRMEDIGSVYFNDLFNRGFFQTKQSTYDHEVCYTFHDLIHDLALMVAFKECLTINGPKPRQIPPTIRHLSIEECWAMKEAELEKPIVRPLVCLEGKDLSTLLINRDNLPLDIFQSILDLHKETKFLRVMRIPLSSQVETQNLEGKNLRTLFNWHNLPSGIFQRILDLLKETKFLHAVRITLSSQVQTQNFNFQNFVSLRYLRIKTSGTLSGEICLPGEICKLYHLEVLHIERELILKKLPNNFSELVNLQHFNIEVGNYVHNLICDVGKLTSLQELNHFKVQQKKGFEIEQLGSLKEIGGSLNIWSLENVKCKRDANMARLAEKEKLDALYLQWDYDNDVKGEENKARLAEEKKLGESVIEGLKPNINLKSLHIDGYGGVLSPPWLYTSLIFLESLSLEDCKAWKVLPPIGELDFLKHLKLSGLAVREIGPQCYGTRESMKFPSLEELWIIDMEDLKKWVSSDQHQQFLCFKKLKTLVIRYCPKLVDLPLSECATFELLRCFLL